MATNKIINVEIAYATPSKQTILTIQVEEGSMIKTAIQQSNILTIFPEIDLDKQNIGVFSKKCKLSDIVHEGDRIEIYRPLCIDPKEARRAKSKKKRI